MAAESDKVLAVVESVIFQGHPTEHFGKTSVRMEGCLKISKFFFLADALDFSNFSENHKEKISELMCLLLSCPIIFGRLSMVAHYSLKKIA